LIAFPKIPHRQLTREALAVLLLIADIFFLSIGVTAQTNYYVSTTGNNSNPGTLASPWQTLQHAASNVGTGDVVNVRGGTYNEKVEIFASGTQTEPITFQSYQNETAIIDGGGITSLEAIIGIWGANYITIDGFIIQNSIGLDAIGIVASGSVNGIKIINNEIRNIHFSANPNAAVTEFTSAQPIIVLDTDGSNAVNNIIIKNNEVHDCRTGYSEALTVGGNIDGFLIKENTVYNISNIGIDAVGHYGDAPANDQPRNGTITQNTVYNCISPYALAAGIYIDGGKDIVISRNEVYNCQWGIEVGCEIIGESTSRITVINNIIYENDDAALAIGGYDFLNNGSGRVTDCLFRNNTCYGNDKNAAGLGEETTDLAITYTENCTIQNNIFYVTNSIAQACYIDSGSINLTLDYNIYYETSGASNLGFDYAGNYYYGFSTYQSGASQDPNSLGSNPLFVDLGSDDFHLQSGSPATNLGDPSTALVSGETDFDGATRVVGGRIDAGAFESGSTIPNQEYLIESTSIELIHEPDSDVIYISGDFTNKTIQITNTSNAVVENFTGVSSPISYDLANLPLGKHFLVIRENGNTALVLVDLIKQ